MEIYYCRIHYEVKPIIDIMIGTALVVTQFALRIIILYAQTKGRLGHRYIPSTEYRLHAIQNTIFPVTTSKINLIDQSKSDIIITTTGLDVSQARSSGGTGQQFTHQRKSAGYGRETTRPRLTTRYKETTTVRFESRQRPNLSRYQRVAGNATTSSRRDVGRQANTNRRFGTKPGQKSTPVKTIGAVRNTCKSGASSNRASCSKADKKENVLEAEKSSSTGRLVAASLAAAAAKITAALSDSKVSVSTNPMSSSDTDSLRKLVYGPTAVRWFHTDPNESDKEIFVKEKTTIISFVNDCKTAEDCKRTAENDVKDDLAIPTTSMGGCKEKISISSNTRFRKCGMIMSSGESQKIEAENPELPEKQIVSKSGRESVSSYTPMKFYDMKCDDQQSLVLASKIPAIHTAKSYTDIATVSPVGIKGFIDRGSVSLATSRSKVDQTDLSLPFSTHSQRNVASLTDSLNKLQKQFLIPELSATDVDSQPITPMERFPQPQGGGGSLLPSDDLSYNSSTIPMKRKNRTFYNRLISPVGGLGINSYLPSKDSFVSSTADTERSGVTLTQSAKSSLTISNTGDSVLRFTEDSLLSFEQGVNSFFTIRENGTNFFSADQSGFTTESSDSRSLSFGANGIPTSRGISMVQKQDADRALQERIAKRCTLSTGKAQNGVKTEAQRPSKLELDEDQHQSVSVSKQCSRDVDSSIRKESFPAQKSKKSDIKYTSSTSLAKENLPVNEKKKSELRHTSSTNLAKQAFPSKDFNMYKKVEVKHTGNVNQPKDSLSTSYYNKFKTKADLTSSTSLPKPPLPTPDAFSLQNGSNIVINRENSSGFPSSVPGTASGKGFLQGLRSSLPVGKNSEIPKQDSAHASGILTTSDKSARHSYPETKSSLPDAGRSSLPEPLRKSKYEGLSSIIVGPKLATYKEPFPKLNLGSATTTEDGMKKDSATNMGPGFSRITVKPYAPIEPSQSTNGRLDPEVIKAFSSGIGAGGVNVNRISIVAHQNNDLSKHSSSSLKPFIERGARNYPFSQTSNTGSPLDVSSSGKSLSMGLFCSLTGLRKVRQSDSVSFSLNENANKLSESLSPESKRAIGFASSTSGTASKISNLSNRKQTTDSGSVSKPEKVKPIPLSNLSLRSEGGKASTHLTDMYKVMPFSSPEPKIEALSTGQSSAHAQSYNGYSKRNKAGLRRRRQKRPISSTDTSTGSTDTLQVDFYDSASRKVIDQSVTSGLKVALSDHKGGWIQLARSDSHSSYKLSSSEKYEDEPLVTIQPIATTDSSVGKTPEEQKLSKEQNIAKAESSIDRPTEENVSTSQITKDSSISKTKSVNKTEEQQPSTSITSKNQTISKTKSLLSQQKTLVADELKPTEDHQNEIQLTDKSQSESHATTKEGDEHPATPSDATTSKQDKSNSTVQNKSNSDGFLKQRIKSSLSVGLGLLFESASFIASVPLRAPRAFFSNRKLTNRQGSIDRLETAVEEVKKPIWHSCDSSDSSESFFDS